MIESSLTPGLRRARILERVQRDGRATLAELAIDYAVSPVTVHRDLELLSAEGLVERVHGGGAGAAGDAAGSGRPGTARAHREHGRGCAARPAAGGGRDDGVRRRVLDRAFTSSSSRRASHAGDQLAGDRARGDRRVDP